MHQCVEHPGVAPEQRILHVMRNPVPLANWHLAVDFDMDVD